MPLVLAQPHSAMAISSSSRSTRSTWATPCDLIGQAMEHRATQQHRVCAQGQRLEHIGATADAAVGKHHHVSGHGLGDAG